MIYVWAILIFGAGFLVGMMASAILSSGAWADLRTENSYMKSLLRKVVACCDVGESWRKEIEELLKEVEQ